MTLNQTEATFFTFSELERYIHQTICTDNDLLEEAFPMSETRLSRSTGELCGVIFCVHGPRNAEFSAIWEKEQNRVLFYKSSGERYRLVLLGETYPTI